MLTKFSLWEEEFALVNISMKFWNFPDISWLSHSATREAARIYQFITNYYASFHLRWKENFLNHQNVSKYCKHDCRFVYDQLWKDWQIVLRIVGTISGLTDSKNGQILWMDRRVLHVYKRALRVLRVVKRVLWVTRQVFQVLQVTRRVLQ